MSAVTPGRLAVGAKAQRWNGEGSGIPRPHEAAFRSTLDGNNVPDCWEWLV
jgi:hypothetical protein